MAKKNNFVINENIVSTDEVVFVEQDPFILQQDCYIFNRYCAFNRNKLKIASIKPPEMIKKDDICFNNHVSTKTLKRVIKNNVELKLMPFCLYGLCVLENKEKQLYVFVDIGLHKLLEKGYLKLYDEKLQAVYIFDKEEAVIYCGVHLPLYYDLMGFIKEYDKNHPVVQGALDTINRLNNIE